MATALEVQFQPAPAYLFDYLTADVQTAECVFDLVDNSIDAARAAMLDTVDDDSMPAEYEGFEIEVTLGADAVVIRDNCSGMSEETFANLAFRAGEKSQHPFGIGHFGVGLKRAILKIGDRCTVETDDGQAYLKLAFTRAQLDQTAELKLPASKEASRGTRFTKITIEDIKDHARRDLSSPRWKTTIEESFGRRYGLFIRKGLVIKLNDETVKAFAPQPVDNSYIALQTYEDKIHGVDVQIVAGVHERYRFAQKDGRAVSDPANNDVHRQISAEYGWYVVCNDRVILLHDTTHKTGWTTNWHGEYAGFVGWVFFRSKDPSLLPWNTKKSDIVENGELYEEVIEILRKMAVQYRQTTPLAKTRRTAAARAKPQAVGQKRQKSATAKDILAGSASKKQLKSIPTLLPSETAFASKMPKLAGLVDESERLVIEVFPYASAIMLRTVFDTALRDYLKRHKKFSAMRDAVLDASLKPEQQATDAMRKNYSPPLTEMTKWCIKNSDVFPDPHARVCKQACERFAHHLPVLNGVVHEDGGISNGAQVRTMRDEVLQGLLHIIGS
jgi:hypothetical protein